MSFTYIILLIIFIPFSLFGIVIGMYFHLEDRIKKRYGDILKKPDDLQIMLKERIYPAIKHCVRNRYKILTGIFGYVVFIGLQFEKIGNPHLKLVIKLAPFIFIGAAFHNLFNYTYNSLEESVFEGRSKVFSFPEFIFYIIVTIISIGLMFALFIDP